MVRGGPPAIPVGVQRRFWRQVKRGLSAEAAALVVGVAAGTGRRWYRRVGGVIPSLVVEPSGYRLSLTEREEIACLRAAGLSVRETARRVGRPASTVSRELIRNTATYRYAPYRASVAQAQADRRARRPKTRKLAGCARLRQEVQDRLEENHSPQQIARRLRRDFPTDPEMWVSHESIYQALYVQGRGGLRRELTHHLRTGRALRKPHRRAGEQGQRA